MASSSNVRNISPIDKYPYSTEFNVLDFVPKLSSEENYHKWESLMRDFVDRQGLVGFIDGTVVAEESNQHDYMAADNLVQRWILATLNEDTRMRVLRFKTAKDMWTELKEIFDATRLKFGQIGIDDVTQISTQNFNEERENRQGRYLALHKAAVNGDWDKAMGIIEDDPDAVRTPITPYSETALHLAVTSASAGRDRFVRELLEKMTPQDLVDVHGATVLDYAAEVANLEGAKMLVNKNSDLPNVSGGNGQTPIHLAAFNGSREMVLYLKEVTADNHVDAPLLLSLLTWGELYDIAFTLLQKKPELTNAKPNLFQIIAGKRSSFPSGNSSFNFWQRLIYSGVPMKLQGNNIANLQKERGGGTGDMENQVVTNCCISGKIEDFAHILEDGPRNQVQPEAFSLSDFNKPKLLKELRFQIGGLA